MKPHRASRTAEFMALFRALESARPSGERLFHDPFARLFLSRPLRRLADGARRASVRGALCGLVDRLWPGARPAGVARTRLIDDRVARALRDGVRQLVILGVGFDSRARRLAGAEGLRVFEVDHPDTLAERRRRLALAALPPGGGTGVACVAADLQRDGLGEVLCGAGFDASRRSFFVWEGVTNYLDAAAVEDVLDFVGGCAPGTRIVFTYVHRGVLEGSHQFPHRGLLDRTLERLGEPWTFGLEPTQLADYLAARGLVLLEDAGSREYRARYLGARGRHLRGYEFYRAALAGVPRASSPDARGTP